MATWLHTHLPRLQSGDPDPISVKVPGQRVEYAAWVSLRNAEFRVHEKGRQRCLRENVRNVHAWIVGDEILRLADSDIPPYSLRRGLNSPPPGFRRAVYDPWKGGTFVDSETLKPVHRAAWVIMVGKNVYYVPAEG
jgi:hypothetical protein